MKLVVATGNSGKLREISALLQSCGIEVVGLKEFPDHPEIVEDGDTFQANALKKARIIASYTGALTLADDSGLAVDVLAGTPGVHSARYAGPDATDVDNNRKLLVALKDVDSAARGAAFHCAMALVWPDGKEVCFEGSVAGTILDKLHGDDGFGYDPLFYVEQEQATFAQIPIERKNKISHRGEALKQVVEYLSTLNEG